jgi:uncharacterized membrane protein YidH (DUF202 family)
LSRQEPVGLQNERTALAWNRTALSLLAAAAAITRLSYGTFGGWSVLCLALTVPLAVWVFWESRARYRHSANLRPRPVERGGRAAASVSAMTVIIGLTELVALLSR